MYSNAMSMFMVNHCESSCRSALAGFEMRPSHLLVIGYYHPPPPPRTQIPGVQIALSKGTLAHNLSALSSSSPPLSYVAESAKAVLGLESLLFCLRMATKCSTW